MILDNGDGDVQTLLKGYSNSQGEINFDSADINNDGTVNVVDIVQIVGIILED